MNNFLIAISSRNPTENLYGNIFYLNKYHNDKKIIIIDSDSTDFTMYEKIKNDFPFVEIHYSKTKIMNLEHGILHTIFIQTMKPTCVFKIV